MGRPLEFWFIKNHEMPFENILDVVREYLNDAGAKEYALKGIEVTAEAGDNPIHREITAGGAGFIRAIHLGPDPDTLSPAFAPRPSISKLVQFRDYAIPAMNIPNPLMQESLMELTARLSHKIGPIMLLNADEDRADSYMACDKGDISFFGFKFTEEFILRNYGSNYTVDIFELNPGYPHQAVGEERIQEAVNRSGLQPCEIKIHDKEMLQPFWHIALEGLNLFYKLKLKSIGTWEVNIATLDKVSDPGVGLYDIFPDGVSYSYPASKPQEEKKPWWKVW